MTDSQAPRGRWKGFDLADLERFGIRQTPAGVEVPYFTRKGKHWRSKLFRPDGTMRFLGKSRGLIPYGLEALALGGPAVVLTEGESDALALRLAWPKMPVLGIPGASSWKHEWTPCLDDFSAVYLSFDSDPAGERLTRSVRQSLTDARVIRLPDGADTRDVLQRRAKQAYNLPGQEAQRSSQSRVPWRASGRAEAQTELVRDPAALRGPTLDVRQTAEYVGGHVPGAMLLELGSLPAHASDLASEGVTVMCGHGERAATAASLLERAGGRPSVFVGGARDWSRAVGRPLTTGA